MKISVEHYDKKITIECEHDDYLMDDVLEMFRTLAIGMTFHEDSWKEAVINMADIYREEDRRNDNQLSERLPEPIHIRSESC
jgi:hypothetical protein